MTSIAWLIALACLLGGAVLGTMLQTSWRKSQSRRWPHEWTITPRPMFSSHDRMLWEHLTATLPAHVILAKVPVLRFCQATQGAQARYWYDLLNPLYVGFVICSPSGRVLVAIDMDSDTQSSRSSLLKAAALQACRIRHVRCRPGALPSTAEIMSWVSSEGVTVRHSADAERIEQAVAQLASTVRKRRAERVQWQDSAFADSFLVPDTRPHDSSLDDPEPRLSR